MSPKEHSISHESHKLHPRHFLFVHNPSELPDRPAPFKQTIGEIIASEKLGDISVCNIEDAFDRIVDAKPQPDIVIISDTGIQDELRDKFIEVVKLDRPWIVIVVATTSPTWQNARNVLLAGADDCLSQFKTAEATTQFLKNAALLSIGLNQRFPKIFRL